MNVVGEDSLLPLSVELQLLLMVLVWFWRVTRNRTCSRCCTEQDQQLQLLIIMRGCLVSLWGRVGPEKGPGSVLVLCSSDGFSHCGSGLIV